MKNTCMVPLVFIATCLCIAVPLSFFVALGNPSSFSLLLNEEVGYFVSFWVYSFFTFLPLSLIFAFMGVFFYLMRHKSLLPLSFLFVIVLMSTSVFVIIPLVYKTTHSFEGTLHESLDVQKKYAEQIFSNSRIRYLPPSTRYLWFFTDVENSLVYPLILADNSSSGNSLTIYDLSFMDTPTSSLLVNNKVVAADIPNYDPVIFDSHQVPVLLRTLSDLIFPTLIHFYETAQKGIVPYLWAIVPFFLSLLSLWPWCSWTNWRLLNILLCAGGLICIFGLYPLSISDEYRSLLAFAPFKSRIEPFSAVLPQIIFLSLNAIIIGGITIFRKTHSSAGVL